MVTITLTRTLTHTRLNVSPSKLLEAVRIRQHCIIECVIDVEGENLMLVPERERTDKIAPNTAKTVQATIRNARENIKCEDLIEIVNSI